MAGETESFTLKPPSLTETLYEALRKRIVNGRIAPGEKLTEVRVAAEYSVARPTAKACLERLTAAGLLRRSAHKTAVVPELTRSDILDLYTAREATERFAVAILATERLVPEEAQQAQELVEQAAQRRDFPSQVEADISFHTALVAAAGSSRLSKMHELIMGEVQLTMGQAQAHGATHPSTVVREHAEVLAAIDAGSPEAAQEALAAHLHAARDRLMARRE
jgi:DNA-binding GntR family transcriptional regulator